MAGFSTWWSPIARWWWEHLLGQARLQTLSPPAAGVGKRKAGRGYRGRHRLGLGGAVGSQNQGCTLAQTLHLVLSAKEKGWEASHVVTFHTDIDTQRHISNHEARVRGRARTRVGGTQGCSGIR